jgi:transposase
MTSFNLNTHYKTLLGLDENWDVSEVDLSLAESKVSITLEHVTGSKVKCPECGKPCSIADHAPQRRWRHLDTMQFQTIIYASIPRSDCDKCGVLTTAIPWALKNSRFSLFFEAFAIRVLEASANVKSSSKLLSIDWTTADSIMKRAVERGLERRETEEIRYIGIDEKSYQKGHSYATIVNDVENGRVLQVTQGRDKVAVDEAFESLPESTKRSIEAIVMDMWPPYINGAEQHLPFADIVHDKFHVSKYLNGAVNDVRKREHSRLLKAGDNTLTGSRQLWLFNPDNMTDEKYKDLAKLTSIDLEVSRAWKMKENFRWFWSYKYKGNAAKFYKNWYYSASHSKLKPIQKAAKTINNHKDNIMNYFKHRITNAVAEGLNSKIQAIKTAARGFNNFESYRTRILFYCGKLDMIPNGVTH